MNTSAELVRREGWDDPMSGYDEGCDDLARKLLGVNPSEEEVRSLATAIQEAVEHWFGDMEDMGQ